MLYVRLSSNNIICRLSHVPYFLYHQGNHAYLRFTPLVMLNNGTNATTKELREIKTWCEE